MVIDTLENAGLYKGLGGRISTALAYLMKTDFSLMESGKYEIDSSDIYALVQKYESKPLEKGMWEGHRKYIDIQYVAEGHEHMGYVNINGISADGDYNEEKDFILFKGEGSFINAPAGTFIIFAPQDVHMPGIMADIPEMVKKVVVKVRV